MTISDSIATQRALPAISSATLNSSAASISSFATQLTSAIEQMLGCHTEPCLIAPSVLAEHLRKLAERHVQSEVVFDRLADAAEFARIVRSYATRISASEVRMAYCGEYIWVRLERDSHPAVNLVLSLPAEMNGRGPTLPPPPASAFAPALAPAV